MDIVGTIVILGVLLGSMILHELAHGLVAYWLGDDTAKDAGRLTLNPLKHLDPVMSIFVPIFMFMTTGIMFGGAKPVPVDKRNLKYGSWGMALVAVAGPLTNFLLALVFFLLGYWTGNFTGWWGDVASSVVTVNLVLCVFNLIPVPPLDGSRVLYAIAPDGVREVMDRMENWGVLVVMLIVVLFPALTSAILSGAMNGILHAFYWLVGVV